MKALIKRCWNKLVFWWKAIIHNMRDNRRKHKILKILHQTKREGDFREGPMREVTAVGKSLTVEKLHIKTKYDIEEIEILCSDLIKSDHLTLIDYTSPHQYLINNRGILAVRRKDFLNMIWFRNWDFWKWVAPLIIGLTALLDGIFKWW